MKHTVPALGKDSAIVLLVVAEVWQGSPAQREGTRPVWGVTAGLEEGADRGLAAPCCTVWTL